MRRRTMLANLGLTAFTGMLFFNRANAEGSKICECDLKIGEIRHMVIFNLKYEKGSPEAIKFLEDGKRILTGIPVVSNFEVLNQISKKNKYTYGFSMVFANSRDYETYSNHGSHAEFVRERWMKEVTDFLEIDFGI